MISGGTVGRATTTMSPVRGRARFSYDASSNLKAALHPDGARVTYAYDASHNVVSIQNPAGRITTLAYSSGRLSGVTDATNHIVRTITYDLVNLRTAIVDARGGVWTNTYNANHNPLSREDPLGASLQQI
jgi:YD repeat-containing protein